MKKLLSLFVAVTMIFATACTNQNNSSSDLSSQKTEATKTTDRFGTEYDIPKDIEKIVSCSPSNTEILVGLGLADKIIAIDQYSADIDGVKDVETKLDMQELNTEKLIELTPDIIFLNEINFAGDDDKYKVLKDAGIMLVNIQSATSLDDIKSDIKLLSEITRKTEKGNEFTKEIDDTIEKIKAIEKPDTKTKVYFEISAAPYFYSFGSGTYLNEIIELCGAENIYATEKGWIANTEESILTGNPDVILSSVSYDGYSYTEILTRKGWDAINAVSNNKVFLIDPNASSRASQNVVKGMKEIANAIYPNTFEK